VSADSLKLTSYFGERQRTGGGSPPTPCSTCTGSTSSRRASCCAELIRGTEGFGARQRTRTDRSLTLSEDLPLIAVAVDTRSRTEEVLDPASRLIPTGLVTREVVPVIRPIGP
jgi:hypothetical protein